MYFFDTVETIPEGVGYKTFDGTILCGSEFFLQSAS